MTNHTLGTIVLLTAVACATSTLFYAHRQRTVTAVCMLSGVLAATSGIILDDVVIKSLGALRIILDLWMIARISRAKERAEQ